MRLRNLIHISITFFTVFLTIYGEKVKRPTILIAILIRNKAHTLPYFLTFLEQLKYPKERVHLWIRSDNNIDNSIEILSTWLKSESAEYHGVTVNLDEKSYGFDDENGIAHWSVHRFLHVINLREEALSVGRNMWADFVWVLDADVFLTNPNTLEELIMKNKTVVAPLLKSDGLYSNFWAGMTEDYYYLRTEKYEPLLFREEKGCFNVPMVHSAVLIDLRKYLSDLLTYKPENLNRYDGPVDDIITFAVGASKSGVPLFVCNDNVYGFVMVPLESKETIAEDQQRLTNIKMEIFADSNYLPLSINLQHFVRYPVKDTLQVDNIYVISLFRRPERRDRMYRLFKELGIRAETVDAIDGRISFKFIDYEFSLLSNHTVSSNHSSGILYCTASALLSRALDKSSLKKLGIEMMPGYTDPYHERPMTMGEIGCFLSHHGVWKKVIENGFETVIILEDDVRFEPFFRQKLNYILTELSNLSFEWDLVYLGRKRLAENAESWVEGSKYLVHAAYSYWTLGYILSARGAQKLVGAMPLKKLLPVDEYLPLLSDVHPRKDWNVHYPDRNLIILSANPLLIYPMHYTGEEGYVSDTENSTIVFSYENLKKPQRDDL